MLNNTEDKQHMVHKESVLNRIKILRENLFEKKTNNEYSNECSQNNIKENLVKDKKAEFIKSIKADSNTEEIKLHRDVENGIISIKKLSMNQKEKLIKYYEEQLKIKKKRLEYIKLKIQKNCI